MPHGTRFRLYTDVTEFHPIQFLSFLLHRVFIGPRHICSVRIQAGQPLFENSVLEGNIYFTLYLLPDLRDEDNQPPQSSAKHTLCSKWSGSSSVWGPWHCQPLCYLHRFVWRPPSHLRLFSGRKTSVFKLHLYYPIFQMFQVEQTKIKWYKSHAVTGAFKCSCMTLNTKNSTFIVLV